MKRRTLIIVSANPSTDPRAAEALRIAAGVATWKKTELTLCLHGPAATLAGQGDPATTDARQIERHLAILSDAESPILVCSENPPRESQAAAPTRLVTPEQLAILAAQSDYVIRY